MIASDTKNLDFVVAQVYDRTRHRGKRRNTKEINPLRALDLTGHRRAECLDVMVCSF